jgi:hypothetical protein
MAEEKTGKVEKIRERTPRELECASGATPKDDTKHTRWVRDKRERIRKHQQLGYEMAKEEHLGENHDGYKDGDGNIRNGDLVLMIGNREGVEEREQKRFSEDRQREQASMERFRREAGWEEERSNNYVRSKKETRWI